MLDIGEKEKEVIRPEFNRCILVDFQGAQISSDAGLLLFREVDERFNILGPIGDSLEDPRTPAHTQHTHVRMSRQRLYQIGCGYEDCNDADFLRIDPALRLALGKDHGFGARQAVARTCRFCFPIETPLSSDS